MTTATLTAPDHRSRARSRRREDPPAGRLVVRRLRRRRRHSADRRRDSFARRSTCAPARRVLDVAAGNGNVTLAAARRWCDVTSTDYVPALLDRGRARAAAEGWTHRRSRRPTPRRCRSPTALRCRGVDLRRHVHAEPGQGRRRTAAGLQARRQDRARQLDARRLHRPAVQDARQAHAAAGRREVAGAVGHARAHRGNVRRAVRRRSRLAAAQLRVPLPLAGSTGWTCSRPTTGRC